MKILIFIMMFVCSLGGSVGAESSNASDWVSPTSKIPRGFDAKQNQVAEEHIYECKITRLGVAIDRLKKSEFIEISDELARFYAGHSYRPARGRKAYLIRGVFANYTGEFYLYYKDGIMLVQHLSLGGDAKVQFCPMVVQLLNPPRQILLQVGGAK